MTVCCILLRDRKRELVIEANSDQTIQTFASLSGDPDSIDELVDSSRRFVYGGWRPDWLEQLQLNVGSGCASPHYVIDLPGRLIAFEHSYPEPPRTAHLRADWPKPCLEGPVNPVNPDAYAARYHLSAEWSIRRLWSRWREEATQRREKRDARNRAGRQLLDDNLCHELAMEILFEVATQSDRPTLQQGIRTPRVPPISKASRKLLSDRVLESPSLRIHARWLLRDRQELAGNTLRDHLLADLEHIEKDLVYREEQWIVTGDQPPGLSKKSYAYRLGECGPGEFYALFRAVQSLISAGLEWVDENSGLSDLSERLPMHLEQHRQTWLVAPQDREFGGFSAEEIIDLERRRIPLTLTGNGTEQACECPLCELTDDEDSVTFWHVEEGWTPPDFVFSPYADRWQWKEYCDWNSIDEDNPPECDEIYYRTGQAFSVSISKIDDVDPEHSPFIMLFDLGGKLGELMQAIDQSKQVELQSETWMQHFRDLRTIMNEDEGMVSITSTIEAVEKELSQVQTADETLAAACNQVRESMNRLRDVRELGSNTSAI